MKTRFALLLLTTSAVFAQVHSRGTKQPFTICISMDNPVVTVGSDVDMRVELTNTSKWDLSAGGILNRDTGIDSQFRFEVHDEQGKLVPIKAYPHPELAGGNAVVRTLKPNERFVETQGMGRLYDLTKPGKYTIQVWRQISNNPKNGAIKSNIITITVTDKPEAA